MPSGQTRLHINTLERAVSNDIMRLQAFQGRSMAELMQYMFDAQGEEDLEGGGSVVVGSSTTAPMRSVIVNGITPRPEIGGTSMFIDPGVGYFVNPDASPSSDDSPFKFVSDPGVQTAGEVTLDSNVSGSTRIDVLECARDPDKTIESDSRDIYNKINGLFVATSVPKVIGDRLQYRIRKGTPGAGYPGAVDGWLPLAVIKVPNTATTFNDCSMWDVRPLASDLEFGPFNRSRTLPKVVDLNLGTGFQGGSDQRISGLVEAVFKGRRIGGMLRTGTPTLVDYIEPTLAAHQEPGTTLTAGKPWFLYLCFPFGLPRWCRFSEYTAGIRKPLGPRGIPVVSGTGPSDMRGIPSAGIAMPSATGLATSTTDALAVAAGKIKSGIPCSIIANDKVIRHVDADDPIVATATPDTNNAYWTFADNDRFPANAKEILISVNARFTGTVAQDIGGYLQMFLELDGTDGNHMIYVGNMNFPVSKTNAPAQQDYTTTVWIPMHSTFNWNMGVKSRRIHWTHNVAFAGGTMVAGYPTLNIVGWKL